MQKLCGKDSHTRDGFLELFVSVNSGKVKLRVQLRIVAFPPRELAGTMEMHVVLEQGICGLCA
jgi:hypothetical protein